MKLQSMRLRNFLFMRPPSMSEVIVTASWKRSLPSATAGSHVQPAVAPAVEPGPERPSSGIRRERDRLGCSITTNGGQL